jgi:hypothetical protein
MITKLFKAIVLTRDKNANHMVYYLLSGFLLYLYGLIRLYRSITVTTEIKMAISQGYWPSHRHNRIIKHNLYVIQKVCMCAIISYRILTINIMWPTS